MKTFTTYATKAKQFLNLLQGYTKGIRMTALLILLLMGVCNASAVDLYLRGIRTWDAKDQTKMSQNGSTYSVITYLSTVEYKFKIADSGWNYDNNYEANSTSAKVSLNTAYTTYHNNGKGDMSFTPSTAGFYKFSLNTSDSKLTISQYAPSPTEAPSDVVNETNVMFYIQGYSDNGYNVLRADKSNNISSNSYGLSKIDYSISYVNTKKTNLSTNYYISNNPSSWNGKSNNDIKNAKGGELFEAQDNTNKIAAKTATTTTSVANTTLNISTTTESKTGVCNGTLYIQYYINNNFTGVTYNSSTASYASISANGNTARKSTLDISDYANGTYTLKTILTDGIIYYIADTDEFTVNNAKRHDVTISYLYNSTSIKPSTTESVSESTATEITAPAIDGYKFSSWTLGTGIVNKSANTTVNPISITTKESGVYTLTANYEEDLTSTWYIAGTAGSDSPFTGWDTSGTKMYKKTGHSTEKKYYCTFEVTTTASSDNQFEFQVYNSSNGSYYGYNNFWITKENNSTQVYTNNPTNMKFRPYVTGTYEFELDCTGDPKLTVTWPSYNQIRFYSAGGDEINTYNWENTNTNTWTKTISLTKGTHYFKVLEDSEFLGNNGTMSRNNSSSWLMEKDKNNCGINADVAGDYLFTYDKSTNKLTVTYPTGYKVTYGVGNNKGTDAVTTDPSITSGSLVLPSTSITFSKGVTKAGYKWKNWNSKADGTGTNLGTGDTYVSSNRTGDISVYACYDLITYNITYNTNGGTGATNTTYNVTTATITLPTPSKTGYTFAGWYDNEGLTGNAVTQITKGSTGHKVFWAKWEANTYTVIFNKNANDATGTMTNQSFTYDEAAKALTTNTFTRTGYSFAGWNTKADGTGTSYTDGQKVQNLTTDNNGTITLYAQWTINKYNITYTAPTHGTFTIQVGSNTPVSANTTADYNTTITLANTPATGYHFSSWNITPNVSITNNQTFSMPASDVTIGATFEPNTYTITWNPNGGTVDPTTSTYIYDGAPVDMPNPERTGCTFNGWFTESTGGERVSDVGKDNKPTSDVTYYAQWTIPAPTTDHTAVRVYEEQTINGWIAGDGAQATPYQFYNDETVRLTVTPLTEVAGLTAYYKVGETEQTTNTFDLTNITTELTPITITTYYKDSYGKKGTEATTTVYFQQVLTPEMVLLTTPGDEISLEKVQQGTKVEVSYSATYNGYTGNVTIKANETTLTTTSNEKYATEYTPAQQVGILTFTATTEEVAGRVFEVRTEVAVYKLVTIKVNDPNSILSNVYMWRGDDAGAADVKTEWPGESFAQHFGTWRVFVVKYPYYDHFIVNGGSNDSQTFNYEIPSENKCYQLSDNKVTQNGFTNYTLTETNCPGDLAVSNIDNITLTKGEQKIVVPSIQVSLGNKLSDVTATVRSANTTVATAIMSGTNIIVYGHEVGSTTITVEYTLHGETVTQTFQVTVERDTHITIQVKVPDEEGPENARIGWKDQNKIYVRYWLKNTTGGDEGSGDILMTYLTTQNDHLYLEASVPLGSNGKANFHFYFSESMDDWKNNDWRRSRNEENISVDGCYRVYNDNDGDRGLVREGYYCFEDEYQIKIEMQNGKEYSSNIVTSTSDILSFFAPGKDEVNYRSGVVMLYKNGNLHTTIEPVTFPESNVYTAQLNADGTGLTNVAVYSGNFYIRTWGTDGDISNKGWNSIHDWTNSEKASRTFTEFVSREYEFYNHYWVQAMNKGSYDGKDVSACVANDYNDDIAGKLLQDKNTDEHGDIKLDDEVKIINVRFGYDPRTNYFGRAVLKGSEYENYLNLHCDNAYADKNCTKKLPYKTVSNTDNKFRDISNWVYERDIYVQITNETPSASLYIEAKSPKKDANVTNHLLGYVTNEVTGEETTTPIQRVVIGSGTDNGVYLVRVVYDFKTNRLIAAWLPQGTVDVSTEKTIDADVLFVRKENEEVPQINLSSQGKIKSLESMFFAMEFHRVDKNPANRHQEQYWFTLPFDCKVGSISGVHGYMQIWGIQRYNGKKRAENGWFNPSTTFWEWLTPDDVMHAGEGYLLVFDKKTAPWNEIEVDKTDADGNIIYEKDANGNIIYENDKPKAEKEIISLMRLYFPSTESGFDMQQQSDEHLRRTYQNHTCTITTANRYLQDSNWKVIGTTSYNNAGISGYTKDSDPAYEELSDAPSFRYQYEYTMSNDNKTFWYKYTPENGQTATYKSFYGYMVQFAGTINWQPIMSETVPEKIAARRYVPANERTSYTTRLELANAAGELQDLTFVALDEKATTGFDQNKDLNKVLNRGTNIYTFVEGLPFAGNTLPMEKATVPVGVRVATAGEYTFRMPDGTDGIAVTLVDNATGTHTNMLMSEYTVTLNAGTIENRFYLVVDPDRTATSVENIGEEAKGDKAKGVEKFLIDGKLFIRTADGIFDAKGQRL